MNDVLPDSVRAELLAAARKREKRKNRLRVVVGDDSYPLIALRQTGFTVDAEDASHLRGLVDIYDGIRHLSQCLIIAAEGQGDLMHYEFKRNTAASDGAPLDYERPYDGPIALLGN